MRKVPMAVFDDEQYYVKDAMLLLKKRDDVNLKYITCVLNSHLIHYFYRNYYQAVDVPANVLEELPIKTGNDEQISKIQKIVEDIQHNLKDLQNQHANTNASEKLKDQLDKLHKQMNDEIYLI